MGNENGRFRSPTDALLARFGEEIAERQGFIDSLVEEAEKARRDLTPQELELVGRSRDRISELNTQVDPLRQAAEISAQSRERQSQISQQIEQRRPESGEEMRYRSAGDYVMDRWRAGLGEREAVSRIDLYHRAAAHQTTADNPGLLPEQVLGPVINFVDESRPLVAALGPRQLPSGSWSRPRVTQHTNVAPQAGEKTELVSRKMLIDKVPVAATTYGGYVNVSRQDIDFTSPGIMDIIINDLAGYYAQVTEDALGDALVAAATDGPDIPTGTPTPAGIATAIWGAVGAAWAAVKGQGRVVLAVAPDMLGMIGPVFAPINPQNAQSSGLSAGNFGAGIQGVVSGLSLVMGPQLAAGTILVISTAAAEVYEDRIGSLQVVEPSVLGVQVAYAGYFAPLVIEPLGIQAISKTP